LAVVALPPELKSQALSKFPATELDAFWCLIRQLELCGPIGHYLKYVGSGIQRLVPHYCLPVLPLPQEKLPRELPHI
jgi:hypothetical protein